MLVNCVYCAGSTNGRVDYCRECWYGGRVLADNLAGAIRTLEVATGTVWYAEHTGGECFWLCTRPDGGDRYEGMLDDVQPVIPMICVTEADGPMSGTATIAELDESGWMVGAYADYWCNSGDEPKHWICSTEEMPLIAKEAQQWLQQNRR